MAIHFSILGWEIPWTEEPGGLLSVHGVTKNGNNWALTYKQTQSLSTPEVVSSNITSNLLPSKGLISVLTFVAILLLNQSTALKINPLLFCDILHNKTGKKSILLAPSLKEQFPTWDMSWEHVLPLNRTWTAMKSCVIPLSMPWWKGSAGFLFNHRAPSLYVLLI